MWNLALGSISLACIVISCNLSFSPFYGFIEVIRVWNGCLHNSLSLFFKAMCNVVIYMLDLNHFSCFELVSLDWGFSPFVSS